MKERTKRALYTDVLMAGFGGQGLMFIGKLLAYTAMKEGKSVTWIPSYGPEMRGGKANCTVVISDEEIASPVITSPHALIMMNNPSLEAFELVRGYNDSFPVTVKNILVENANLFNVSMSVTGYLSQYLQINPEIFDEIPYNETKQFNVTIISPTYMKKGTYQLNISITGDIIGHLLEMNFTDNRFVTLVIHEVSREEANSSIMEASWFIDDLSNAGFKTTKISRILEDAQEALEDHDYESAKELCDGIETMKENAFLANDLINQVKNSIENNPSRSFNETQAILNLAIAAFEREDYETAFLRAQDAMKAMELETREFDLAVFIFSYWWAILSSVIVATVVGVFLYQRIMVATITRRIRDLGREEENIGKLMVEAQKKRFDEKTISSGDYRRIMNRHQKRLTEIKSLGTKLRHKRVRLLKKGEILKDLDGESSSIMDLIKSLQENYFKKHVITKNAYDGHMKSYNERLAEIEDERLTLETMLAKGEKK